MTTDTAAANVQPAMHANCIVCGQCNGRGLRLEFEAAPDGSVHAEFDCDAMFEGYAGKLHGGIISAILDGAMTNCLFEHGHPGVTAELTVRFRHPVQTAQKATVRAWIERCSPPLHVLRAELSQDDELKATAIGKFMDHSRAG
ncbi:MAG: PaaI family thioesterase [Phycisphaerae bacterium]|nr:PaaI family thioesterase [Phycisphaerae bacterium]